MEKLFSAREIAELCGVRVNSVRRWAARGLLPRGRQISSRCTRWTAEDVQAFLRSRGFLAEEDQQERC